MFLYALLAVPIVPLLSTRGANTGSFAEAGFVIIAPLTSLPFDVPANGI
jgi:hypothetical protein